MQAVHGIGKGIAAPCGCGCGNGVVAIRNRNGKIRRFASDKCRQRFFSRAREIGVMVLRAAGPGERDVARAIMLPDRIRRAEMLDLDAMPKQERLGRLARAAERMGVLG